MTLTALRLHDEDLRRRLAAVREALAAAVLKVEIAEQAATDLAASRDRSGGQGAYRDVAAERVQQWETEIEAGKEASAKRERLRREEASLLEELETARLEIEREGVRQHVLPGLDGVAAASPCAMRWHEMTGDGDARTCPRCKGRVLSLAMQSPEGAQKLVLDAGGAAGLRRRADGTFVAGDCAVGAATARKWRSAPLAIGAGFVIGGIAAAAAVIVFGAKKTSAVDVAAPPQPTPSVASAASDPTGVTGTSRPPSVAGAASDASIVARAPLSLDGFQEIDVTDTASGLGGDRTIRAVVVAKGDHYYYSSTCNGGSRTGGVVRASVVRAFLSAVKADPPTHGPRARCSHTDDFPSIRVDVRTSSTHVRLRVENCSRQWLVGDRPLAADAAGTASSPHPTINAAYEKLLDAAGEGDCHSAFPRIYRPRPPPPGCDPPFYIDEAGEKIFKRQCLL